MQNNTTIKSESLGTVYPLQNLAENRVQALKSLAMLLLKELELLETLTPNGDSLMEKQEISLSNEVEHFESELIRTALIQTKGHQVLAAKLLGTKLTTLNAKLKRYEIDARNFRLT